jgi:hypothetical protein
VRHSIPALARATVALGALVLAGASGSSPKPVSNAPPPGFGGAATASAGQFGAAAVSAPNWDVQVALSPTDAKVAEESSTWQLTSEDNRGAVTVVVMRDPSVRDVWALAESLRQDRKNKGEDVADVEQWTLVGLPGARWISVAGNGVATMVVLAQSKACVYMLIASAQGTTEEIVAYFKWASELVRTVSGGAANAPACR